MIREEQRRTVEYIVYIPSYLFWNLFWRERGTCATWDLRDIFWKHVGEKKMMSLGSIKVKIGWNEQRYHKVFGEDGEKSKKHTAPTLKFSLTSISSSCLRFLACASTCQISQILGSTIGYSPNLQHMNAPRLFYYSYWLAVLAQNKWTISSRNPMLHLRTLLLLLVILCCVSITYFHGSLFKFIIYDYAIAIVSKNALNNKNQNKNCTNKHKNDRKESNPLLWIGTTEGLISRFIRWLKRRIEPSKWLLPHLDISKNHKIQKAVTIFVKYLTSQIL